MIGEITLGTINLTGMSRIGPLESISLQVTGQPVAMLQESDTAFTALVRACRLGDVLGNDGRHLLYSAAELIERFAPHTAAELRRKADAEEAALRLAGVPA